MADEQSGLKKDYLREFAPWTKLFSAFKVAMDPKKLLLAGAGILAMALGWWILAAIYFNFNQKPPMPENYKASDYGDSDEAAWKAFKDARRHWNLMFEMAGDLPATRAEAESEGYVYDAADLADSLKDWNEIKDEKNRIENELARRQMLVKDAGHGAGTIILDINGNLLPVTTNKEETYHQIVEAIKDKQLRVKDIKIIGEGKNLAVTVKDIPVTATNPEKAEKVRDYISKSRTVDEIRAEVARNLRNARVTNKAIELLNPRVKPAGLLRTLPWFENRGPNQYLLITGNVRMTGTEGLQRNVPWERGEFFTWFVNDQLPVLVEPLIKFLRPIIFLLDPAASGWNLLYLILVILWTLAVWGFFGGAITRMAAVQVARQNEKVSMTEAVRFAYGRYKSFFLAPLFPLLFLAGLTIFLFFYGLIARNIPVLGDIVLDGLLWPVILLVGFIMAVVLVGLVGWPLMYPTISTEGSDSFDAISRSYSYLFQAPWQYLWYIVVSLVYGAVLIFFVGLMGSLMVYLSKWGIAQAPGFSDRNPEYLFMWAPTSFGWRDLLLHKAPDATTVEVLRHSGQLGETYTLNRDFVDKLMPWNYIGTFLVSVWLYLLFLMIVGFGYSYFWTVSTIIYILMRRNVDDTEMDEVHLEQAEPEMPYPTPPPTTNATVPAATPGAKPGGTNLTLVEPPTLRAPINPTVVAPPITPGLPEPVVAANIPSPTSTMPEIRLPDGAATPAAAGEGAELEEKKPL